MSPEVVDFLREVGDITGNASVGRGIITCVGAAAVILATGWRMLRTRSANRVKAWVDAPAGEKVLIQLGNDTEEQT